MTGAGTGEQMKKYKIAAIISGVLTLLQLVPIFMWGISLGAFKLTEASAVGIIGGADGPTAIYTTAVEIPLFFIIARYVFLAVCFLVFAASIAILIRNRHKG